MNRIQSLTRIALCTALLCLCAWVTVPAAVPFTLQSFGVALILLLLGGKQGLACLGLYLLLAAVGLPVLAGGRGGIGTLVGVTGGYLLGFVAEAIAVTLWRRRPLPALVLGTLLCYTVAVGWTALLYADGRGIGAIILTCVVPYLIPDAAKLVTAHLVARRLQPLLRYRDP